MNTAADQPIKIQRPYFILLLPIFFVLHGFAENFGFISVKEILILTGTYVVLSVSIYLFSFLFFRDWKKAALITVFRMLVFFFFGAVHEFLKQHSPLKLFSRYSFLIPAIFVLLILSFIFLKKTQKRFQRFTIFLNTLLIIYIVVDTGIIAWRGFKTRDNKLSIYDFARAKEFSICDTCKKPNIYLLLFDEYASSSSLKEKYDYVNKIDSFFDSKKFSVQTESRSNYNFTVFSLAAMLNMSYIEGIKDVRAVTAEDYGNCNIQIRDNKVIQFLGAHGYKIINYSIFDLAGHPAIVKQSFLPLQTKLITERTLFARLNKDIGWIFVSKFPFNLFSSTNQYLKTLENDNYLLQELKKIALQKEKEPRFVYTHFNMPHAPFFFDKNGVKKDNTTIYNEYKTNNPTAYLDYLNYTNAQLKDVVNHILINDSTAVILLLGDHGLRITHGENFDHFFQNLNAVYYPDGDYKQLYDSISGVNQFRVVFNKLFNQHFPILKDSSILLRDKQ